MRNRKLLKDSIDILILIRDELHDDIDSSKRSELDKAIKELENAKDEFRPSQMLNVIGRVVILIPAIERILKGFDGL